VKKGFFIFFLFLFSIWLFGCKTDSSAEISHMVTQIDISCQQEDVHIHRHYTDPEKMEKYLLYLRLLELGDTPSMDAEHVDADVYRITVLLSDGRQRIYRQKDHRYWSTQMRPWQTIDPAQAAGLYHLMRTVPGDLPL